jgi:hemerythrin-like metal-binding protein
MLPATLSHWNTMNTLALSPVLEWSDALVLNMPAMDQTHLEFVDLLAEVVQATDDELMPRWATLISHTQHHFDQEDRWMLATGFATNNCHSSQHQVVLQVLREGEAQGHSGRLDVVRDLAEELGRWFPQHAQTMDVSLALHLRSEGYDPATGQRNNPTPRPSQTLHGCGGSSCSGD